jgi:hypothetical protein
MTDDKLVFNYNEETTPARTDNILLQGSIGTLYSRATLANVLAQIEAGDYAVPQSNVYYVGKHGNDSNAGTSPELAYLTFSAAITAASSGDAVVCLDGGEYEETITCKDGVNIFAPNATYKGGGASQYQIVMAECEVAFFKVWRPSGANALVLFDAASGRQKFNATIVDDQGSGVGMRATSGSIPIVNVKEAYASGGGVLFGDFTAALHYHIVCVDAYANSNNAILLQQNVAGNNGVATIQHMVDLGFTGTVALDINDGTVNLFCNEIVADTAWDVESGATLNIVGCSATGTKLNDGTVNKWITDDRTQTYGMPILFKGAVSDGDYLVALNLPKAITITKVTSKSTAGTCTATVKIGSTALGGTANSVSTTEQEQAHSTSNTAAAGDDLTVTVSANSSCENMSLMIEYTAELD